LRDPFSRCNTALTEQVDEPIRVVRADDQFDTGTARFDPLTDAEVTVEFYDTSTPTSGFL
jgi:hypothetical protein